MNLSRGLRRLDGTAIGNASFLLLLLDQYQRQNPAQKSKSQVRDHIIKAFAIHESQEMESGPNVSGDKDGDHKTNKGVEPIKRAKTTINLILFISTQKIGENAHQDVARKGDRNRRENQNRIAAIEAILNAQRSQGHHRDGPDHLKEQIETSPQGKKEGVFLFHDLPS